MLLSANRSRKGFAALFLLAFAAVALVLLPNAAQPALATSPLVQTGEGVCSSCTSFTVALSSGVTAGDGLIVVVTSEGCVGPSSVTMGVTDSLSTGTYYSSVVSQDGFQSFNACYLFTAIWAGNAAVSGASDTLTITVTSGSYYATAFDYTGLYVAAATTGTGSLLGSTGTTIATTSTSFGTGAFLVAAIASAGSSYTAGSDFTKLSEAGGSSTSGSEYSVAGSGVTSPTTFPATQSANEWGEVAAEFPAGTLQPIDVAMSNSAPASTVTMSACSLNNSTFSGDGNTHGEYMTPGCNFALSFTNAGNTRDGFSVSSAFSATSSTETSSTTLLSLTAYEQVSEDFAYSITGAGTGYSAPTLTGTQLGASGTSIATLTTTPTPHWLDYNTGWSATNPLTGSGYSEQWSSASSSGTSSAGSSVTVAYQNEYATTGLTVNGCNGESIAPAAEHTGWWNAGDTISVTCNGVWSRSGGTGDRAISYNWNGGSNTAVLTTGTFTPTIAASTSETLNVNPTTQYFVTLDSGATAALVSCNPTIPGDGCWYDSGTTAQITLNGVFNRASGSGGRLEDWQLDSGSVNGLTTTAPTTIQIPVISAPHTIYTTTVTQYQVSPSAGLTLSAPTITADTGWYDANAQVTITGEGGAATYVVSSPIWANQVSSYGMQMITNAQAGSINFGSLDLVYACSAPCWTRLYVPTASGLSVQTVTQGGVSIAYATQGFITAFSTTSGSSNWDVYFGQASSNGGATATTTTRTTTSSTSSAAAGGLFSNPSTTSYLEIAGLVAVLVAAVAVLMLKDKQGARNIVIKIRNKVG